MILPISEAYGTSTDSPMLDLERRSTDGSIGDITDCPDEMLKHLVIMLMNDGCEICIVPRPYALEILTPSR